MIETWNITIPELTADAERRAYVYLPEALAGDPDRRYPVLYMFDGHNIFFDTDATYGKSWGMKEYMDYTDTQMIIAAVECNHSPDHGRLKEYSPFTFSDPEFGKIEQYTSHNTHRLNVEEMKQLLLKLKLFGGNC